MIGFYDKAKFADNYSFHTVLINGLKIYYSQRKILQIESKDREG